MVSKVNPPGYILAPGRRTISDFAEAGVVKTAKYILEHEKDK